MARLLRDLDYRRLIQDDDLLQIIESNDQIKLDAEQTAQAEMKSYLAQRYQVDRIFANTSEYASDTTYYANNLVEYTEADFSTESNYNQGDRCVRNGEILEANTDVTAGVFNADQWDYVCDDLTLFYVNLPYSEYDPDTTYAVGTKIWFKDKVYTNQVACTNVMPTESGYWGTGVTYKITGIIPTDTRKWTHGDNRNQQIITYLLDITLYHILPRISPRNIPDLRKERYNGNSANELGGAIGWLKAVAKGNVMADLPVILPEQGLSMRYGSSGTYDSPSHNQMW